MQVKTFKDGERFVIVFEGLEISEQEVSKAFLQSIVGTDVLSDAKVKPMVKEEENPPAIPDEKFPDGPYIGKTPKEAMREFAENLKLQGKLAAWMASQDVISKEMQEEISAYLLRRFEKEDPSEFAGKLNPNQLRFFYQTYEPFISSDIKKTLVQKYKCNNYTSFLYSGEEKLRKGVEDIIVSFKTKI